ncbi:hypothetical protein K438DRAFT_2017416 [Mycena galopus ATCC 62051]|nr:hypothetical protein K438DRAFT_2017416 [Mycena galopus ATCC 62051]
MSDSSLHSTGLNYATFASDYRISRSFFLAGAVILIYDCFLTFGIEVKHIWSSKLRPSTCWFLAVKYIALSANITISAYYFVDLDPEVCAKMQWAWMILLVCLEVLVEVTLSIRVFAMYGLNKWILAWLLGANGVVATVGVVVEYIKHPELLAVPGLSGCDAANIRSSAIRPAGGWVAILICDILVFSLTVRRAFIQRRTSPLYAGSLMQRMANDGSMYFGIIGLANLANVLTFYLGDILISGFLSWFSTNLSVALLSRLMLNLHEAGATRIDTELNTADLESIRFTVLRTGTTVDGGR